VDMLPVKKKQVFVLHADGKKVKHETNAEGKIVIASAQPGTFKILEYENQPAEGRVTPEPPAT